MQLLQMADASAAEAMRQAENARVQAQEAGRQAANAPGHSRYCKQEI